MTHWTKGPWDWLIHDHSMASLGVMPNPGMGDPLVLSVGPCQSCVDRRKEWEWGCCCTPSEADARLIAAAPEMAELLEQLLKPEVWRTVVMSVGSGSEPYLSQQHACDIIEDDRLGIAALLSRIKGETDND